MGEKLSFFTYLSLTHAFYASEAAWHGDRKIPRSGAGVSESLSHLAPIRV
jgi:hypothetical protein